MPILLPSLQALFTRPGIYPLTESVFRRVLGLVYLSAFASLWPQINGLIGSHGVAPAGSSMAALRGEVGAVPAFFASPSLFWIDINNWLLQACCLIGCIAALLLIADLFARAGSAVCWVLYLSLVSIGNPFLSFQWDALLLEAGALAFFAGAGWLVWAYRVLLFKLMFQSGAVKLLSNDVNWTDLHALRFHFLTQPLPSPLAYYVFRAPAWLLDAATAATLVIELVVPFFLFGPRLWRQIAVLLLMLLQLIILLTGNYAFFNLLTLALCLWGLDDRTFRVLSRFGPRAYSTRFSAVLSAAGNPLLACYIALSAAQVTQVFLPSALSPLRLVEQSLARFQVLNNYGLFAVMTTERPELVIQGSNDQIEWRDYDFPYKPGELHRALPLVAPYQPRLDWQMWFAALGTFNENPWVGNLMYRILVGDPAVLHLLSLPPFSKPPRYLRVMIFNYTFTDSAERNRTGAVWRRQLQGTWFGPVSLTGR